MPDLTPEIYYRCKTVVNFHKEIKGSKGDIYNVSFGPFNQGDCICNWHCTCKGFQFRKTCSHIKTAEKEYWCGWDQFIHEGDVVREKGRIKCPRCGAEAEPIKHMV